jgi:hypothetical protein
MTRRRVVFQPVENRVTVHSRQRQIERDRVGTIFTRRHQSVFAVLRDETFKALFVRDVEQNAGKTAVVFDNQQNAVAGFISVRSSLTTT